MDESLHVTLKKRASKRVAKEDLDALQFAVLEMEKEDRLLQHRKLELECNLLEKTSVLQENKLRLECEVLMLKKKVLEKRLMDN